MIDYSSILFMDSFIIHQFINSWIQNHYFELLIDGPWRMPHGQQWVPAFRPGSGAWGVAAAAEWDVGAAVLRRL